jgi:hypothetical protein
MPTYFFHIRQGKYASTIAEGIELANVEAARQEAAMICSDMARDIVSELGESPEWQMEVTDGADKTVYRLTLRAELLEDG